MRRAHVVLVLALVFLTVPIAAQQQPNLPVAIKIESKILGETLVSFR